LKHWCPNIPLITGKATDKKTVKEGHSVTGLVAEAAMAIVKATVHMFRSADCSNGEGISPLKAVLNS